MKLLFPFRMSLFPLASVALAQPPSPQPPSGAPSPKTTEMMVILTAKAGVTRQQIMTIMPAEIRNSETLSRRQDSPVVLERRRQGRGFLPRRQDRGGSPRHHGDPAVVKREPDGARIHSGRSAHAARRLAWRWTDAGISRAVGCAPVPACSPIRRAHENKTRRSTCHQKPSSGFISL